MKSERWWPRTSDQLGNRGKFLLLVGACWLLQGLATLELNPQHDSPLAHDLLTREVRAVGWILTGVVALVWAWRPRGRSDAPAFAALFIMPGFLTLSYALGWIDSWEWTWNLLGAETVRDKSWRGAVRYGVLLAVVYRAAVWGEPLPRSDDDEQVS